MKPTLRVTLKSKPTLRITPSKSQFKNVPLNRVAYGKSKSGRGNSKSV